MPYKGFEELLKNEIPGKDFKIKAESRNSKVLIMAPHGGRIEFGTTEIAEYLAGEEYSFYSFIGLKEDGNGELHVSSNLFDEPKALESAGAADLVITIHGMKDEESELVVIGGLDSDLNENLVCELKKFGFQVEPAQNYPHLTGLNPNNICNKGKRKKGTQIEISGKLRRLFLQDKERLAAFKITLQISLTKSLLP